jgi:hypothetical protein
MRLLELVEPLGSPAAPVALRLHPRLAVVELSAARRDLATARLDEVFAGLGDDLAGLVEAHGILLDLTGPTLVQLTLDGVMHPIVRSSDLPGVPALDASRARRRTERHLDEARRRLAQARQAASSSGDVRKLLETRPVPAAVDDSTLAKTAERLAAVRLELAGLVNQLEEHERQRVNLVAERHLLETRHHDLARRRDREVAELAAAIRNRDERLAGLGDAESRLAATAHRLEQVRHESSMVPPRSAAMAAWRTASSDVAAAETRLGHLRVLQQQAQAHGGDDRTAELTIRRAELQAEWDGLDRADGRAVQDALALLAELTSELAPPDAEAEDLARRYSLVVEQRGQRQRQRRAVSADQIDRARERTDQARWELADAQRNSRGAVLDRQVRATIEQAHEAVLEAERRAARAFGFGSRHRLEELRRLESELLASFGLRSFSDYLLAAATSVQNPAADLRYSAARRDLSEAERVLAELQAGQSDEQLQSLEEREQAIHAQAVELLGHDPGHRLADALRSWRPAPPEAVAALQHALADVGIVASGASLTDAARAWLADRAVAGQRDEELRSLIGALDGEIAAHHAGQAPDLGDRGLGAELEAAERHLHHSRAERDAMRAAIDGMSGGIPGDHGAEPDDHLALATTLSEREGAQRALAEAEREADRWQVELDQRDRDLADVGEQITHLAEAAQEYEQVLAARRPQRDSLLREQERLDGSLARQRLRPPGAHSVEFTVDQARLDEDKAIELLGVAERQVTELALQLMAARESEASAGSSTPTEVDVDQVEFYVLGRLAAQRSVGIVGSVPVVFDDAFAGLTESAVVRLLHRLERLSEAVQVVYLTDDPMVLGWASNRPADRVGIAVAALTLPSATG